MQASTINNGTDDRVLLEESRDRVSYRFQLDKEQNLNENGSYMLELRTNGKIYRMHILIK